MHNNYLTLPVVFLMIANHYPLLFATRYNWVIVAIVLAIGPVIRHFYNSRHEGSGSPWWTWGVAAAGMIAVGVAVVAGTARDQDRRTAEGRRQDRPQHRAVPLQHVPHQGAVLAGRHIAAQGHRARQPRDHHASMPA